MDKKAYMAEVCRQTLEKLEGEQLDRIVSVNDEALTSITNEFLKYYAMVVARGALATKVTKH